MISYLALKNWRVYFLKSDKWCSCIGGDRQIFATARNFIKWMANLDIPLAVKDSVAHLSTGKRLLVSRRSQRRWLSSKRAM
jgi:hypothetical protein